MTGFKFALSSIIKSFSTCGVIRPSFSPNGVLEYFRPEIAQCMLLSSFPPPTMKGKAKKYCSGFRYLSISVKTSQLFWKNTTFAFPADFERLGNIVDNCNLLVETIMYSKSLFDESSSITVGLKIISVSFLAFSLKSEQIMRIPSFCTSSFCSLRTNTATSHPALDNCQP